MLHTEQLERSGTPDYLDEGCEGMMELSNTAHILVSH